MQGPLCLSTNRGRYAIGSPSGPDLTAGMNCAIQLDTAWIAGSIEYGMAYANQQTAKHGVSGYYFICHATGDLCGLCIGMMVRIA